MGLIALIELRSLEFNYFKPNKVALTRGTGKCVAMFDQVRSTMISEHEELINLAANSKKDAERAIQECKELKDQNENLKSQIEEVKAENEKLKESDVKSKMEVINLSMENEEMKVKLEAYGQLNASLSTRFTCGGDKNGFFLDRTPFTE